VDHTPVKPAFGYRIDYSGRSVVLSGDTRISENLIGHAQNVDLLIHEVFARTKPKLAVYSPIVLPDATEQDLIPPYWHTLLSAACVALRFGTSHRVG
jgi:ribonuclease Z